MASWIKALAVAPAAIVLAACATSGAQAGQAPVAAGPDAPTPPRLDPAVEAVNAVPASPAPLTVDDAPPYVEPENGSGEGGEEGGDVPTYTNADLERPDYVDPGNEDVNVRAQPPPSDDVPRDENYQAGGDTASVEVFYDSLSPYGEWVYLDNYGRVWRPAGMPVGWRPYTQGQWIYTRYGWTWVSDFEWGWGPFHYGWWNYDSAFGWVWVPGTVWGPAWVTWRWGGGAIGWAPWYPDCCGGVVFGFHYWVFVDYNWFYGCPIAHYYYPTHRVREVFHRTRPRHAYRPARREGGGAAAAASSGDRANRTAYKDYVVRPDAKPYIAGPSPATVTKWSKVDVTATPLQFAGGAGSYRNFGKVETNGKPGGVTMIRPKFTGKPENRVRLDVHRQPDAGRGLVLTRTDGNNRVRVLPPAARPPVQAVPRSRTETKTGGGTFSVVPRDDRRIRPQVNPPPPRATNRTASPAPRAPAAPMVTGRPGAGTMTTLPRRDERAATAKRPAAKKTQPRSREPAYVPAAPRQPAHPSADTRPRMQSPGAPLRPANSPSYRPPAPRPTQRATPSPNYRTPARTPAPPPQQPAPQQYKKKKKYGNDDDDDKAPRGRKYHRR